MKRRSSLPAVVATGLAVATTANAVKPFARDGAAAVPSFANALLPTELPLETAVLQGATLGYLAARGRVRGKLGRTLALATAGSAAALYTLHREALRSGDVLEAALLEGLGPDYRSQLGDYRPGEVGVPLTRKEIRVRSRDRKTFVTGPVLSYGDAGKRNELDVWRRADLPKDGKAPVLLQVHGGAWILGNKQQQAFPLMKHLAEQGWVCVSINYRLSPRATWPDHIVDVKRAIGWVKANIAAYGGDPDFIAITGGSAGGHLSSLAAVTPNLAAYQPGFEDVDTTVQAAVPFYGIYDFTNRDGTGSIAMEQLLTERVLKTARDADRDAWDLASPMSHIGPHVPPIFFLHGTNDSLVPVEQARAMVRMQREVAANPVVYAELPKAQHAFEALGSVRAGHTARAVARFLSHVHTTHSATVAEAVPALT